ncbi:MAG TPA: Ldh family oxidoreductase [Chloroflexota bacterium]|nr:Ldh family oxidoreductase [Chloroflexota bacterium]
MDIHAIQPATRVTVESLRAYGIEAFLQAGLPEDGARAITEVQLESALRGQPTHNMGDVPGYCRRIKAGQMNPRPDIRRIKETGVSARIDGDNGPGQWVSVVATGEAIARAKENGVGIVGVQHSNHFGAAGHYAWLMLRENLIGLATTNGGLVLAPWGGVSPTFGNNPLGVGIPAERHLPILLDIAMSVVAQGKIGLAIAEGKPIPLGWLMDKHGHLSTNPADAREGLGVPIAEHKGYGLALVMETLAGLLSGAKFCLDHDRETFRGGAQEHDLGHFFLALNPEMFMPIAEFTARVDRMIDDVKKSDVADGVKEVLLPGEPELRSRERNLREGIPLLPSTLKRLLDYQHEAGLQAALVELGAG